MVTNAIAQAPYIYPFSATTSATYEECLAFYQKLDQAYPNGTLLEYGPTDAGKPLHLFVIDKDGKARPGAPRGSRAVLLVMNGIHPGEPDGIDASMIFCRNLLSGKLDPALLDHVTVCVIPSYNIGGMLNRGCCSRANQDGPEEYGFRGNRRNLDLNRDFIKSDASNTLSFVRIFRDWDPDVFVDTHVSDGADYPYTMTLISTQHNKLHPAVGTFLKETFTPAVFGGMRDKGDEIIPYINTRRYGMPPETGIYGFLETPRYSSGYTALFHTLGFVAESHMLKPFPERVNSTYRLLLTMLEQTHRYHGDIRSARDAARDSTKRMRRFPLNWTVDTMRFEEVPFSGYTYRQKPSTVTGRERGYYDHGAPFQTKIRFYDHYVPEKVVAAPEYYMLPQAWREVTQRLEANGVKMIPLDRDTAIDVEVYYILDYETVKAPYEGRYLHSRVSVRAVEQKLPYYRGDFLIPVNQPAARYIVETLEPEGVDSWFAWGFFDAILQQKEWFSSYVYEEKAAELLQSPELRSAFDEKLKTDSAFANDSFSQLYFIYRQSPEFEKSLNRYPVGRILKAVRLKDSE